MASQRTVLSMRRCLGCQRQVLSTFIDTFRPLLGFENSSSLLPSNSAPRRRITSTQTRLFSSGLPPKEEALEQSQDESQSRTGDGEESATTDAIQPWYLQIQESAIDTTNPFAARQQLPELPPNPPPILQPMLKHISIDLGLDYLSVVDLRPLDPPPALGSGTIMIFGSVRSFKHLNVSADRLCRWLRTNYNLTPHADGLLGRNELKLKLRRRARRARILSAAGGIEPNDTDDGITTGWICVNVGEVEDGPDKSAEGRGAQNKGFVGFGKETNSARVVVQMMTEDKRNEMDLEALWQALLEREGRKKEGERRAWERLDREAADQQIDRENTSIESSILKPGIYTQKLSSPALSMRFSQQVRGYHTSVQRHDADRIRMTFDENPAKFGSGELRSQSSMSHGGAILQFPQSEASRPMDSSPSSLALSSAQFDNAPPAEKLRILLTQFEELESSVARQQLGAGEKDKKSTEFLRAFHDSFPPFPELEHFLCILEFQCHALKLGHAGYTRLRLVEIFRDMQVYGIWVPKDAFILGLEVLFLTDHQFEDNDKTRSVQAQQLTAFNRSLGLAFELVERMEAHGYDVRTPEVLLLILDGISNLSGSGKSLPRRSGTFAETSSTAAVPFLVNDETAPFLDTQNIANLQYKFRRALDLLNHQGEPSDDPVYLALMEASIRTGHWSEFWETWRHMARMAKRRGPRMYTLLFEESAKTANEAKCQNVLLTCVPEMKKESPPVQMKGAVAMAVLQCLVAGKINEQDKQWKEIIDSCKEGVASKRASSK